ncbi:MAG: carbohydrate binding domain-containing protein, partial [Oscillospiraceae bacterium]|nr:carbohydrate binding domain-containing protein [Oscillospiraceae bacterium]
MKKFISVFTAITVICGLMTHFTVSAEPANTNDMYALYTFNETMTGINRTVAADRSGNGHDAQLFGSVKYEADTERQSKVLYTSGINGSYMEFPLPTDENGKVLESFTVSMDIKNLTTGNYFNFYVGDGSSNGTGKNYFGYKMAADILLSAMTGTEKKITLTGKGVQGEWTHVDFVIDDGTGTMYVDGSSAGSLLGYTMDEINAAVGRLSFSAWAADSYAKCFYDNVAIYNKAFTADEIAALPQIDDPDDNYDEEDSGGAYKITSEKDVDIGDGMIGLFFEDINYAADGGLYAEMIENRSFEALKYAGGTKTTYDGTYSWSVYPPSGSGASLTTSSSGGIDAENNRNYAVFTASENQNGLKNNAYDGVLTEKGKKYNVSLYAKASDYNGGISVSVYKDGKSVAHAKITDSVTDEWKKYEVVMTADKTARCADIVVELDTAGTVSLDMISCFPEDSVEGLFRRDLAEKLKDINPGFLRFPGGCIIEGYNLANRYDWKDTLGDIAHRKQNWSRWAAHTNDGLDGGYKHYNQTYGLGFYEYFLLCEYLECKPVPVVNAGMACQYQSGEVTPVDSEDFKQYIQDALDLIEFANGDASTAYGAIRAEMGHPEPFDLEIIGIGNEQWQTNDNDWFTRYERFEAAIHEKYPDMKLVATSGPGVQDNNYYTAWSRIREKAAENESFAYVVDEHYYRTPDWFYSNINFYDSYPRDVKVFAGEYASRRRNWVNDPAANTWETALSEAAYLTMVERNADVVYMASYAPLFARINYTQWSPDMIWFDDANSYGTPSYYVQKLYSNNMGDYTLKSTLAAYGTETGVYSVASYDEESGDIILKIANSNGSEKTIPVEIEGFELNGTAEVNCIKAEPQEWNTIAAPQKVSPKTSVITDFVSNCDYTVPAYSFTVLRIGTTEKKSEPHTYEPQPLTPPEPVTDKYQVM